MKNSARRRRRIIFITWRDDGAWWRGGGEWILIPRSSSSILTCFKGGDVDRDEEPRRWIWRIKEPMLKRIGMGKDDWVS